MVHGNHRLFCDRVTKRLTTGQHHARVEGVVQPLRLPILVAMEKLIIPNWWISSKILTLPETADENAQ